MGVGADLLVAIPAYTGLSPAAFFTLLALLVAFYYILAGCFARPPVQARSSFAPPQMEPLPEPVQLGEISEEELSTYNGSDPKKPLLMAIKGQIYDVSQSRMFYGPDGPYALFAGKDASRALAKMSFDEQDLTSNLEGLGACEMDALNDWEWKFNSKYAKVGQVMTKEKGKSRDMPISDVSDNIVEKEGNSDAVSAVVEESKVTSRELEEVKEEKQVNEEVKEEEPSCVNGEVKEEETSTKEVKEEKTSSKEVNGEVKEEETSSKEVNGEVKEEETFIKEVNGEVKEETSFKETKVEAS